MATITYAPTTSATANYYMRPTQNGPSPPEPMYGRESNHINNNFASGNTPPSNNISPTNLHPNINVRQLRKPRHPLGVPAALRPPENKTIARPTDIPGHPRAPDTPPGSKTSSLEDDLASHPSSSPRRTSLSASEHAHDAGDVPADSNLASPGLFEDDELSLLRRNLSRNASETLSEEPGDVTGQPTTAHWKPDASTESCYICKTNFTWYFRRHHCRRCGNVVCMTDVKYSVPLDQNARYHPRGTQSKACKECWDDWRILRRIHGSYGTAIGAQRDSRSGSLAESSSSSQGTAMPIPNALRSLEEHARVGSLARSEGMVWSTF